MKNVNHSSRRQTKSSGSQFLKSRKGLLYLFTGDGKGKTSAALGTAMRAVGNGWQVVWIAFYKEASWGMSDQEIPEYLARKYRDRFQMYLLGKGFYIRNPEQVLEQPEHKVKVASTTAGTKVIDDDTPDTHRAAALAALEKATSVLADETGRRPDVLILDEVCNAVADGLLLEKELLALIEQRGSTHIVLTGRSASQRIIEECDLVSEITKIKHPYDKGVLAVKGLDY